MEYGKMRQKLIQLFDRHKLESAPGEWGFYNEEEREIRRVGCAVNLTPGTIAAAGELGVDFILTHHDSWEFVFGLKERCNALLKETHMTHGFFHAPLDDADFGTSASLTEALGAVKGKQVMPYADVFFGGRTGELDCPEDFEAFARRVSEVLNEPVRRFKNHDHPVKRICVAAGGGNMTTDMKCAAEEGCDTYITGEYALYSQMYASVAGMNLLVGSHTNTEIPGIRALGEHLAEGTDLELVRIPERTDY